MKFLSKKRFVSFLLVAAWSAAIVSILWQNRESFVENNFYLDNYFTLVEFDLAVHEASPEIAKGAFYYDTGGGFNEGQLSFVSYEDKADGNFYHYSIKLPEFREIERIRFDPLEGSGSVTINNVVVRKFGETQISIEQRLKDDEQHSIESLDNLENGLRITTNGEDPFFILTNNLEASQEITFSVLKELFSSLKLFGGHEFPQLTLNMAVMETNQPEGNYGKLFFDTGAGFNDQDSVTLDYRMSLGTIFPYTVELPTTENIKRLGFRPLNGSGKILLKSLVVEQYHETSIDLAQTALSQRAGNGEIDMKFSAGAMEFNVQDDSIITIVKEFAPYQEKAILDYIVHPELRKLTFTLLFLGICVCLLIF